MAGAATTSCEDMFTKDSELYTTDLEPQDTLYQMQGIINRMQALADRVVLLGEVRADLVEYVDGVATTDIQNLAKNDVSTSNRYNSITDYYAVVNACNIFINRVDTTKRADRGLKYYEKEYAAAKSILAWTYLQLTLNYGKVPFVTEPVLTAKDAQAIVENASMEADLKQVCDYFITELKPYVNVETPHQGITHNGIRLNTVFFPVRLMLGDLYLWRASITKSKDDYLQAAVCYHDYLDYPNQYKAISTKYTVRWYDNQFNMMGSSYDNAFNSSDQIIAGLPLDTCAYDGTYSELAEIYNSQYRNNYYPSLKPSSRLKEISEAQDYCLLYVNSTTNERDTLYSPKNGQDNELFYGDLRLFSTYETRVRTDREHAEYSEERQTINKFHTSATINGDARITFLPLYRLSTVYLRLAEALNGAGFPESAFVILKYGVSSTMFRRYASDEYEALSQVATAFDGNLASWNSLAFIAYDGIASDRSSMGIHSLGSGDSEYNEYYVLPSKWETFYELTVTDEEFNTAAKDLQARMLNEESTPLDTLNFNDSLVYYADSILSPKVYEVMKPAYSEAVADYLMDEKVLENCFEGHRFYDLMRESFRRDDPTYLANKVAMRKGEDNVDEAMKAKLSVQSNWYLPKPSK